MKNNLLINGGVKLTILSLLVAGAGSLITLNAASKGAEYLTQKLNSSNTAADTAASVATPLFNMKCDTCKNTTATVTRQTGKAASAATRQATKHECADCQDHIVMTGSGKTAQFHKEHSCSNMKTASASCCATK
jgi:hypothetical protein